MALSATITSTVFANLPVKAVHVGNVTVSGQVSQLAATATVGDILFLCKIPHGAKFVGMEVDHTTPATALGIDYGLATGGAAGGGASFSCCITAGAKATMLRRTVLGEPVKVSVSDNDPNRYGIFAAQLASGTTTESFKINFSITYRTDE